MKLYHLHHAQFIARPLEDVFAFFEQPDNLSRLTPPSMGFVILTPSPIKMRLGALIDYTVRIMGFGSRWTTLITDYEPPRRFVDVQLKGPYAYWHHTHVFEAQEGGTRIMDDVRYMLPFGILGRGMHFLFVKKQLKRIFDYREKTIEEIFAPGP